MVHTDVQDRTILMPSRPHSGGSPRVLEAFDNEKPHRVDDGREVLLYAALKTPPRLLMLDVRLQLDGGHQAVESGFMHVLIGECKQHPVLPGAVALDTGRGEIGPSILLCRLQVGKGHIDGPRQLV